MVRVVRNLYSITPLVAHIKLIAPNINYLVGNSNHAHSIMSTAGVWYIHLIYRSYIGQKEGARAHLQQLFLKDARSQWSVDSPT